MIEQNKAVVRRFNKEVIEGKTLDIMDELFHPDFINQTVRPGFSAGPEGMRQFLTDVLWKAFSDIQVTIHDQVAEGDKVTSRKTISANHTGEFLGESPSHKRVDIDIMDIVRLEDGRYKEHWSIIDMHGLLQQLATD